MNAVEFHKIINSYKNKLPHKFLSPFGIEGVLVYSFPDSNSKFLSPDIYFCNDFTFRYQVLDLDLYLSYVPKARIQCSYSITDYREFIRIVPADILIENIRR
jgi:hypothetical protein